MLKTEIEFSQDIRAPDVRWRGRFSTSAWYSEMGASRGGMGHWIIKSLLLARPHSALVLGWQALWPNSNDHMETEAFPQNICQKIWNWFISEKTLITHHSAGCYSSGWKSGQDLVMCGPRREQRRGPHLDCGAGGGFKRASWRRWPPSWVFKDE